MWSSIRAATRKFIPFANQHGEEGATNRDKGLVELAALGVSDDAREEGGE